MRGGHSVEKTHVRKIECARQIFLALTLATGMIAANAAPVFMGGASNTLTVTAVQNLVDQGAPGLSPQDTLYGILSVDNNRASGSEVWDANNVIGMPIDSFSGYFAAQVTSVFNAFPASSPYAAAVTFGPASTDPNGKLTAAELAAGSVFKLYIDSSVGATPFETNGSISDDVAKATDGVFWGTLGFAGSNAYWSALVLKNGQILGSGGLDFIANATGMEFDSIANPSCSSCATTNLYFSTVVRDIGAQSVWRYGGSNSATFQPNSIPEPGTLALVSVVGAWFGIRRRRSR